MKKLFTKGLLALLPMGVTIVTVYFVISLIYTYVGVPLGNALNWVLIELWGSEWTWFHQKVSPILGLFLGVTLVFFIGAAVATFFGKKIYQLFESTVTRLPVIGVIYPYAKQFTEFFSPVDQKRELKHPVAVPFPTHGVYSIGFVTGDGLRHLNDAAGKSLVTVFVPTAPTPFSGFVCYVPREEVVPLPMTVDDALRVIISCGVLTPPHQTVSLGDFAASLARGGAPAADPKKPTEAP